MVQEHTKSFNSNITLTVIEKFQPSSRADHISIFFGGGGGGGNGSGKIVCTPRSFEDFRGM